MPDVSLVLLAVSPLVVGGVVLAVRRVPLRALLAVELRGLWLVWLALAVQLVRTAAPAWARPVTEPGAGLVPVVLMWTLGMAFVAVNLPALRRSARAALVVVALGATMNTVTTAVNGGMPFLVPAAEAAGFSDRAVSRPSVGHIPVTDDTLLLPLADVIGVPALGMVMSVGDLLMVGGLTWVVVALVDDPRRRGPDARPGEADPAPLHLQPGRR